MSKLTRRDLLVLTAAGAAGAAAACARRVERREQATMNAKIEDSAVAIERTEPLGFPWQTQDPFLFCVHHDDQYPAGNDACGPQASLVGRNLGQDFVIKDGWRMYHGEVVPGFPHHPHRGFETVTVVRQGHVDHSDSMGAAGRYGAGDTQWMTAGRGVQHAEMFPLLDPAGPNPLELFQIWLNLPARRKMVDPYYKMLWAADTPRRTVADAAGRATRVTIVAGPYDDAVPPAPPPDSWAAEPGADVAIWTLALDPRATFTVPAARPGTNRTLYYFRGTGLRVGSREVPSHHLVETRADLPLTLTAGSDGAELLLLQGRPIGEPVVQHGPFVMGSKAEIYQAIRDYQATQFGGWPWPRGDQIHPRDAGRFARYADGREERPV